MNIEKLNIGIIGLGEIGQAHCDALSHISSANLVAISDINQNILHETAIKTSATPYLNFEQLLMHEGLDAVIIATPDKFHAEPALKAIKAGKHILVEKPLATTIEEAEKINSAALEARKKLMVGFTLRFIPQYQYIKKLVETGDLGVLESVFARRTNLRNRQDKFAGKIGVLFFLGVHDFDVLRWIIGSNPVRIYSEKSLSTEENVSWENETFTTIMFKNGVIATAQIGWCLPENHPAGFDFKLDVTGTKGVLSLDMLKQGIEFYSIQSTKYPPMIAPLIEEDRQFIKSILDDKEVPVTGFDGLMATKMALAAMESIETHKSIEITY